MSRLQSCRPGRNGRASSFPTLRLVRVLLNREEHSMPLRIRCPGCQALSDIPDTMAGQKLRCKHCQKLFQVGKPPAAKPKVAEPPAGPAKQKAVEPAAPPS